MLKRTPREKNSKFLKQTEKKHVDAIVWEMIATHQYTNTQYIYFFNSIVCCHRRQES